MTAPVRPCQLCEMYGDDPTQAMVYSCRLGMAICKDHEKAWQKQLEQKSKEQGK